jgi:hypothetical protein
VNWEAIGSVGEVLGAVGVIATLGYLAIQIRQNTASNRQAAARASVDTLNRLTLMTVEYPEIADLLIRGMADRSKLELGEALRFHNYWISLFVNNQETFFHAKSSNISPDLLHLFETHTFAFLRAPGLAAWWQENKYRFSSEFVAYIEAGVSKK